MPRSRNGSRGRCGSSRRSVMPTLELVSRDLRSLTLAGTTVDYVLVRRRGRRGVGFKVDANGLTVNAPATMPLARIESLVRESERWVLRKIVEWRSRLVKARSALIDYVICHELAHLRHMNHSPAFWAEVERQCPGHARLRDELFATDHLYRSF